MGNAKEQEEVLPKSTTLFKLCEFEDVFTCTALMQATRHRHFNILLYPTCKILPAKSLPYRSGKQAAYLLSIKRFPLLYVFPQKVKCYFSQTPWLFVSYRTHHKSLFSFRGDLPARRVGILRLSFWGVCFKSAFWLCLGFLFLGFFSSEKLPMLDPLKAFWAFLFSGSHLPS